MEQRSLSFNQQQLDIAPTELNVSRSISIFEQGSSNQESQPPPVSPRKPTLQASYLNEANGLITHETQSASEFTGLTCQCDDGRQLPASEDSSEELVARENLMEADRDFDEASVTIQRAREEIISSASHVKHEIAAHSQFLIKAVRKRQVELMKSVDCIEEQQHARIHHLLQLMRRSDNELDILHEASNSPGIEQSIDYKVGCRGAMKRSAELLSSAQETLSSQRLTFVTPTNAHEFFAWGAVQQGRPREYQSMDDVNDNGALNTLATATAVAPPMHRANSNVLLEDRGIDEVPNSTQSSYGEFQENRESSQSSGSDDGTEVKCDDTGVKKQRRECGCASRGTHRTSCYLKGFVPDRPSLSEFKPKRECGCAWKGRHLSMCSLSSAATMASATLASIRGAKPDFHAPTFNASTRHPPHEYLDRDEKVNNPNQPQPQLPFMERMSRNDSSDVVWV